MDIFKGVLWDHGEVHIGNQRKNKIVVVGILLTNEELGTAKTNIIYEGGIFGLGALLKQLKSKTTRTLGDAVDVLCSLGNL